MILQILKIIGLVLLILLLLLLLIMLALLFVPVRYSVTARNNISGTDQKELEVEADVSWLLRLLSFRVDYKDRAAAAVLKVLGIRIRDFAADQSGPDGHLKSGKASDGRKKEKAKPQRRAEEKAERTEPQQHLEEKAEPYGLGAESTPGNRPAADDKALPAASPAKSGGAKNGEAKSSEAKSGVSEGISSRIRSLLQLISSIPSLFFDLIFFLQDLADGAGEKTEQAFAKLERLKKKAEPFINDEALHWYRKAIARLIAAVKHYRPRKARGWAVFGTGEPDVTAMAAGLAYVLLPASAGELSLEPLFNERAFQGDIGIKGRIRAVHVVWFLVRMLLDKETRVMIRNIRKLRSA